MGVWPPIWQDGYALPLDEVWNNHIEGNPTMKDPATGRWINNAKSWLTDQSYTGGHGEFPNGTSLHEGPHNNFDNCTEHPPAGQGHITTSAWWCAKKKYPWAYPGFATELGEGCGIHGGNPFGCPYYVLSWRWDAATAPQVWVSCANIEIVDELGEQAR